MLNEVLEVFELPTWHFLMGSIPLVHQVLSALVELRDTLTSMCSSVEIHAVTRFGAQAAFNVYNKYMENLSICKVYYISLVMCQDVKLSWFYQHYSADSVEAICKTVLARFEISYPSLSNTLASGYQSPEPIQKCVLMEFNVALTYATTADDSPLASANLDSIEAYLASNVESVAPYGGTVQYWTAKLDASSCLACMALDYLTAPATSVDAEQAFSARRLTINHLQHNMSSETFKAKMAVGSWYGTP